MVKRTSKLLFPTLEESWTNCGSHHIQSLLALFLKPRLREFQNNYWKMFNENTCILPLVHRLQTSDADSVTNQQMATLLQPLTSVGTSRKYWPAACEHDGSRVNMFNNRIDKYPVCVGKTLMNTCWMFDKPNVLVCFHVWLLLHGNRVI